MDVYRFSKLVRGTRKEGGAGEVLGWITHCRGDLSLCLQSSWPVHRYINSGG